MRIFVFILIFCNSLNYLFAQDTLKNRGWAVKIGTNNNLPTVKNYRYDFDEGCCDRFAGTFTVKPIYSVNPYFELIRYRKKNIGKATFLLNYGIAYNQNTTKLDYSGNYYGGEGGGYYKVDNANYLLNENNLQLNFKTSHLWKFGKKNNFLLNTLNISCGFAVWKHIKYNQDGYSGNYKYTWNENYYRLNIDDYFKRIIKPYRYPDLFINYELGYGFSFKNKLVLIPNIQTSILNINSFFYKKNQYDNYFNLISNSKKYYQNILVGFTIMRNL